MNIAVSSCLLGNEVRFDGGHKRERFITDLLAKYATFTPFCPEALAFGTPRPSIRLVHQNEGVRIVSNKTGEDLTGALEAQNQHELSRLKQIPLTGIIFKAKSPTCGFGSAKVYLPNGHGEGKTDGLFVLTCKAAFPHLPMEEEARLLDPWLRENFIMHLFAYARFAEFCAQNPTMGGLVQFHTVNKFLLQSKNEALYRDLGNVVANHEKFPFPDVLDAYGVLYKEAIACKSSVSKTRNVLEHMVGFFKKTLEKGEKELLHLMLEDYTQKIIPLIAPISAIALLAKRYNVDYLLEQTFLAPYPKELALRSHVDAGK
ncbi:MAG: DUF523 and DUF1722 domain-containing protein [Campylobacterales bacterium]|nr:DUF523 and DUF1722 domain-containing protein [Campylobacterales bacterium]